MAEYYEETLDGVRLGDVASLVLEHARCQDVGLRGARIDQVGSVESLRGCTLSRQQAEDLVDAFAEHLGFRIG